MTDEDPQVSYSVRDLFARVRELFKQIDEKTDQIISALSLKADNDQVDVLHERVARVEDRVTTIEHVNEARERHAEARQQWRQWLIPTVISAGFLLLTLFQVLHI